MATARGPELGLLIGKHGQTIDAVQYLVNASLHRRGLKGVEAVIDAQGYRKRRERTLTEVALRAAEEVRRTGQPYALEPMTSTERKIVHTKVQELGGLATASEGAGAQPPRGRAARRRRRGVTRETPRGAAPLLRAAGLGRRVRDQHPRRGRALAPARGGRADGGRSGRAGRETLVDVGSGGGSPGIPLALELGLDATLARGHPAESGLSAPHGGRNRTGGARRPRQIRGVRAWGGARQVRPRGRAGAGAAPCRAGAVPAARPARRPADRLDGRHRRPRRSTTWPGRWRAEVVDVHRVDDARRLVVVGKLGPTPERFPRRPGMAGKRPLPSLPSDA